MCSVRERNCLISDMAQRRTDEDVQNGDVFGVRCELNRLGGKKGVTMLGGLSRRKFNGELKGMELGCQQTEDLTNR